MARPLRLAMRPRTAKMDAFARHAARCQDYEFPAALIAVIAALAKTDGTSTESRISHTPVGRDNFLDLGIVPDEAAVLTTESDLQIEKK